MIGNAAEAKLIHDWYRKVNVNGSWYQRAYNASLPEGWKYLGDGCYRAAFLSPSGAVYKVQHSGGYSSQNNEEEAATIRRLYLSCKMPKGTRLPRHTYYSECGVIAMEYFEQILGRIWDDVDDYGARVSAVKRAVKVGDLHHYNFGVDSLTDELVPIDLAG